MRTRIAALVLAAAFVAACSGGPRGASDAGRSGSSAPPDPFATPAPGGGVAPVSVHAAGRPRGSLTIGECFDSSTFSAGVPIDPATITLRLCAGPHQHEVYAVVDYPGNRAAPYPGDATITAYANDRCIATFSDYVGTQYQQSALDFSTVQPTAATWSAGDRQVACVLHDADFVPLTGTMKGTNR